MERMDVEAIAGLAGQARQPFVHASDIDRDVRVGDWAGVEEWRHQRVLVELALVAQPSTGLPGRPDRAQRADIIAQPRDRRIPGCAVAPLDMRLDLRAQAKDEAP